MWHRIDDPDNPPPKDGRKERTCDDCGLPISICNAITSVRIAVARNGQEAVKDALAKAFPPPTEATP